MLSAHCYGIRIKNRIPFPDSDSGSEHALCHNAGLNENCNTSTRHSLHQGCYLLIPLAVGMRIEVGGSLGKGKEGLVQVVELTKKMQMSEGVQIKCRCGNFKWIWSIHRM